MISIERKLEELSCVVGFDGDVEHTLHELCHVVVFDDESLISKLLDDNIGAASRCLTHRRSDWNEILTLGCELVVLRTMPSLKDYIEDSHTLANKGSARSMDVYALAELAERNSKTKAARRRAKVLQDLVHRTWLHYCGEKI